MDLWRRILLDIDDGRVEDLHRRPHQRQLFHLLDLRGRFSARLRRRDSGRIKLDVQGLTGRPSDQVGQVLLLGNQPAGEAGIAGIDRQPQRPAVERPIDQVLDPGGQPVVLRGVAFGNQVWQDMAVPVLHHSEVDYQRLVEMGMNSARFYLHYATFEDDANPGSYKAEGWQWLDTNIAWAKKHGIYLVLNMHVPPGGYQSQGKGTALWDDPGAKSGSSPFGGPLLSVTGTSPPLPGMIF